MFNKLNLKIMEKAILLLSKVDEHNFINLFYVSQKLSTNTYSVDSIMFLNRDDAQRQCDFLNKVNNTNVYRVSRTCVHVG